MSHFPLFFLQKSCLGTYTSKTPSPCPVFSKKRDIQQQKSLYMSPDVSFDLSNRGLWDMGERKTIYMSPGQFFSTWLMLSPVTYNKSSPKRIGELIDYYMDVLILATVNTK